MANDRNTTKTDKAETDATSVTAAGERIAKVMARAGLCSRRDAEAWIAAGRVSLNGKKLQSPAVNVQPHDDVRVDGKPLPEAEKTRLFRYYKPRGLVTTAKDPEGRPTVFDNLPESLPRVISIGRLDINSEGLLLLTNDGELARRLELPATGWVRRYRVRVNGRVDPASLTRLAQGIEVEGVRYGAIEATLDRQQGDNAWLTMGLTEGKNREIRNVCGFFGWTVSRLLRLSYGPFQLGHLEKGEIEEVPGKVLRDQLGQSGAVQPLRPQQAQGGKARPPKPRSDDGQPTRHKRAEHARDDRPGREDERPTRFAAKPDRDRSKRYDDRKPDRSPRYAESSETTTRTPRDWASKTTASHDRKPAAFKASTGTSDRKTDRSERYAEPAEKRSDKPREWTAKTTTSGDRKPAAFKARVGASDRKSDRSQRYAEPKEATSHKPRDGASKGAPRGTRKPADFKAGAGSSADGKASRVKPSDTKSKRARSDDRPSGGSGKHAHRQRRP